MSDQPTLGFGKFIPGFDFLQNLAKGATQAMPQLPGMANWVAPTLNVEELEKRIAELKAVHFWLDQNTRALAATVQALEVQKMTLATLQGMNFSMGDVAKALKLQPAAAAPTAAPKPSKAPAPAPAEAKGKSGTAAAQAMVDPVQWWGALTQQFQQIAADALKDAPHTPAFDAARTMATASRDAMKTAGDMMKAATPGAKAARKAPAKRAAKGPARSAARKAGR